MVVDLSVGVFFISIVTVFFPLVVINLLSTLLLVLVTTNDFVLYPRDWIWSLYQSVTGSGFIEVTKSRFVSDSLRVVAPGYLKFKRVVGFKLALSSSSVTDESILMFTLDDDEEGEEEAKSRGEGEGEISSIGFR